MRSLNIIIFVIFFKQLTFLNVFSSETFVQQTIIGGQSAKPKQFPYQVGLYINETPNEAAWCGGVLISKQFILTAAHCIDNNRNGLIKHLVVLLGYTNLKNPSKGSLKILVEQKGLIKHPQYRSGKLAHDIALIKLPITVELNEYIQPIALPNKNTKSITLLGKTLISSGWGLTKGGQMPDQLQFMKTKVRTGIICYILYFIKYNDNRQVCINTFGKSVCFGDSGGPNVLVNKNNEKILIGITSAGRGCIRSLPQILTRVSFYIDWIHKQTGIPINN